MRVIGIVIGIDPSINQTGVAVLHNGKDVETKLIKTKGKTIEDKIYSLINQLDTYLTDVMIKQGNADCVVIEKPASWTRGHKNVDSVVKLNSAYIAIWTYITFLSRIGIFPDPAPTGGSGLPTKEKARSILQRYFPDKDLSKLNNNEIDALMLAVSGCKGVK